MILVIITNRGGGRNVILTNKRFERRAESKQECTPASINPETIQLARMHVGQASFGKGVVSSEGACNLKPDFLLPRVWIQELVTDCIDSAQSSRSENTVEGGE